MENFLDILDGQRVRRYCFLDSYGRIFSAIPDGSYLFIKNGKEELRGEAYRISEGKMSQIAQTNEMMWPERFADCISLEEAIKMMEK